MDFADWLADELERQGVSRRELGRRLAAQYPGNGDPDAIDSQQRKVRKILNRDANPRQATRDSICDALGVPREDAPPEKAEDDPITREMVLERVEQMISRHNDDLRELRRFRRAFADGAIA